MIIKIRVDEEMRGKNLLVGEDQANPQPTGWWIEDNIRKVHISDIEISVGASPSSDEVDCYLPRRGFGEGSITPGVEKAINLCCRMKDGSERVIVFQGEAYLLNDEGRTIERLVV